MGYHALGSLEIWDRMIHVIIFDESTYIRIYLYVVVLNWNAPVVRKTLFWGGATSLSSLLGRRAENF